MGLPEELMYLLSNSELALLPLSTNTEIAFSTSLIQPLRSITFSTEVPPQLCFPDAYPF